jgi:hypothetical protein
MNPIPTVQRWAVILRRSDGRAEVLDVLHHREAKAIECARSWVVHMRAGVTAEVVTLTVPLAGTPVLPEPEKSRSRDTVLPTGEVLQEGRKI